MAVNLAKYKLTLSLPGQWESQLNEASKERGLSKSAIVVLALEQYFKENANTEKKERVEKTNG
jgi:metal-responsive CopG/Arc/MetJ family transcriptional regulator